MWFEWLARRCDMGALATVSSTQPPPSADQQGFENIVSLSTPDVASMWYTQKVQRRTRAHHVLPSVSPLSSPTIVSNELDLSPIWSPCFDNNPNKDFDYHAGPGGLRALSISLFNDANSEGGPWVSEPFNQLAKNYMQTMQELKQSRANHGYEMPFELERYKELKAGFWKRLATNPFKDESCDSTSISGAQASDACFESNNKSLNATTKTAILSKLQGSSTGRVGLGLNGSVEIEVVLTGKWNALEETIMVPKPNLVADQVQHDVSHVQNVVCGKDIQDCQQVIFLQQGEMNQPPQIEKVDEDSVCRTRASSREASDGESLERDNDFQQHRHQDSSECSFSSGGGIGRGRMREDGSPTSSSSNRRMCEESKASVKNLDLNIKEEDETLWGNANWCVVDSFMTGHGKETTWTVRGFEEDDGFFQGNSLDCKDKSALKIFATRRNHSHFSDLTTTQFLSLEAPNVETQHGPPPKWTQQALEEQVAKNLQAQQKEVRSSKNGFEMVKSPTYKQKKAGTNVEDGGKEEAKCRQFVLDDILHCRKGRKLLKEAILKEKREKIEGGNVEASIDINGIDSISWKSERHSLNACVGSSTYKSGQGKDAIECHQEVLNLVKHREIGRRKRRGAKRKVQSPAAAIACCVSMIGGIVNTLRKTREDATTLALKLVESQGAEVKNLKAITSAMYTHVNLLQSEVKGLEAERGFNVLMVFPWQQFFKNIMIGISLVSGTLALHRAIKLFFQLLFGGVVQTATSIKEKTILALTLLSSGSYVGKEMWQIFSQVQAKKKINEVVFQEKLWLVLERLSQMSTLTNKNGIVHQFQEEETNEIA